MHRILLIALFVAAALFATSNAAHAQDSSNTDQTEPITPASVFGGVFGDSMQVQLTEMATKVIDGYLDYLAKPQTTKKLATFQKNYYDALKGGTKVPGNFSGVDSGFQGFQT